MVTEGAYSDLEIIHPMWAPSAVYAAKHGKGTGAPKPQGCKGSLSTHYFVLKSGRVRWVLIYKELGTRRQRQIAKWTTDWLPDPQQCRREKPCTTNGKVVTIQVGRTGEIARQVRVVLDHLGLPVPVPVEVLTP